MKYRFPIIRTIEDVLPHVKDREEFVIADRIVNNHRFTVVNYAVAFMDTFVMQDEFDIGGAIRRECRGIIFDGNGKLISRPYHKFFNVNEREETLVHNVDFRAPHMAMEKLDGSMVRPLMWFDANAIGHTVYLATKMGVTDIAEDAANLLTGHQAAWLTMHYAMGNTPILEYVSPKNKIVVDYPEPKLILTAIRDNLSGVYLELPNSLECPFELAKTYGSTGADIDEYLAKLRLEEGREGNVIRFDDGHMLKVKNDWYVRIHKVKDDIRMPKNLLDIILNEQVDDVVALLDDADRAMVLDFETVFWEAFKHAEERLLLLLLEAQTKYDGDKKRVALEMVPTIPVASDKGFLFSMLGGKQVRDLLLDYAKKQTGTNTKYEELMVWMNS